mmetsp:Transcript_3975/g.10039  ORF Transcript_3975/g.10039 Transcript_3975/m.10039 type:complete len:224 (+) Transcript_3975:1108-1779(+)
MSAVQDVLHLGDLLRSCLIGVGDESKAARSAAVTVPHYLHFNDLPVAPEVFPQCLFGRVPGQPAEKELYAGTLDLWSFPATRPAGVHLRAPWLLPRRLARLRGSLRLSRRSRVVGFRSLRQLPALLPFLHFFALAQQRRKFVIIRLLWRGIHDLLVIDAGLIAARRRHRLLHRHNPGCRPPAGAPHARTFWHCERQPSHVQPTVAAPPPEPETRKGRKDKLSR